MSIASRVSCRNIRMVVRWLLVLAALNVLSASATYFPPFCYDVAIIGAGPAGTYAAYRLRDKGLKVALYEYSDSVGGRLQTMNLRGAEDIPVEMGGMRFAPWAHPKFAALVKELGLRAKEFVEGFGYTHRTRYFLRNVSLTQDEMTSDKLPYKLTAEERPHARDLLGYYVRKLVGPGVQITPENILSLKTADGKKFLYELSFQDAMDLAGASPDARSLIQDSLGFHVDFQADASFAFGLHDAAVLGSKEEPVMTVAGGLSLLPLTLLRRFQQASHPWQGLFRNHRLVGVEGGKGRYDLHFELTVTSLGVTTGTGEMLRRCAKKVILAVPHLALSRIFWKPLQEDPDVRDFLDSLILAPVSKLALVYPEAFWKTAIRNSTVLKTDMFERQSYDFGDSVRGTSVIIASYADGEAVRFWRRKQLQGSVIPGSLPGDFRVTTAMVDQVTQDFARAFGVAAWRMPAPLSGVVAFYDAFPSGSGWTLWRAGAHWERVGRALLRPVAREDVFLATSDIAPGSLTAWVEGALVVVDRLLENFF